jgi:phytoene dehydrogenase-like protein
MVYVSSASLKDPDYPRYAPDGVMNLELMGLAPSSPAAWGVTDAEFERGSYSDSAAYADAKASYAERLKRVASGVFPGLSDAVVFEEVATPLTHTRYTLSTGGTSYGLALIPGQFLHRRPGAKTEIEGLLLCGASTRMGHGIMGAMMSGLAAAAALVGGGVYREALGSAPAEPRAAVKERAVSAVAPPPA